jgi:hypothetical protein
MKLTGPAKKVTQIEVPTAFAVNNVVIESLEKRDLSSLVLICTAESDMLLTRIVSLYVKSGAKF